MNLINISIILFTSVSAFRLLTLGQVYEKHKDVYIMNNNSHLKFQRATVETITNFYSVIHLRRVLFYTRGTYYGLVYASDGIRLKLGSVSPGKVQYYTQELEEQDAKIPRWDLLLKGRSDKEDYVVAEARPVIRRAPIHELEPPPKKVMRSETKMNCNLRHCETKGSEVPLPVKKTEEIKKMKRRDDIESDSEMGGLSTLSIKVETVDPAKKTFVMKDERNQCVTYFEKTFILSECRRSKRQVFKMVNIESVMDRLQSKEGGKRKVKYRVSEDEDTIVLGDVCPKASTTVEAKASNVLKTATMSAAADIKRDSSVSKRSSSSSDDEVSVAPTSVKPKKEKAPSKVEAKPEPEKVANRPTPAKGAEGMKYYGRMVPRPPMPMRPRGGLGLGMPMSPGLSRRLDSNPFDNITTMMNFRVGVD